MQKVKLMIQDDVKPGMIVHLDKQEIRYSSSRKANAAFVPIECPDCHKERWVCVPNLKYKRTSTRCVRCAQTPRHIGKGEWVSPQGYRWVNIRRYPADIQQFIRDHLPPKRQSNGKSGFYVAEHRLVALFKYGSTALNKGDHDTAYRQMLFWRNFALTLLRVVQIQNNH